MSLAYIAGGTVLKVLEVAEKIGKNKISAESKKLSIAEIDEDAENIKVKLANTNINNIKTIFRDAAEILETVRIKLFEHKKAIVDFYIGSKKAATAEIDDNLRLVGMYLNRAAGNLIRESYSLQYYADNLKEILKEEDVTVLYCVATYKAAQNIMHLEAEEKPEDIKDEKEAEKRNIPRLQLTFAEQDLVLMCILSLHCSNAKVRTLAANTLKELKVLDWVKEIDDINLATKILNSILVKRKKFSIAKVYTYKALQTALKTSGKASLTDKDYFDIGYNAFGKVIAHYSLR